MAMAASSLHPCTTTISFFKLSFNSCRRFSTPFLGPRRLHHLCLSHIPSPPPSSHHVAHHPHKQRLQVRAARTQSKSVPLASRAPEFELTEPLTGKRWNLDDFEAYPALLVMFICNHCPFVIHLKADLVKLSNEYMPKGLGVVAISANSIKTHPQDGPEFMAKEAKEMGYPFPYLYDETQEVAKAYGAACTPDFFVFKKDGRRPFELVYHGQFDDSRPNSNKPITGRDIRAALDCVLSGRPVNGVQRPSMGCSIKWHPTY